MYKKILSICMAGAILLSASTFAYASGGSTTGRCPECKKNTLTRKCTGKLSTLKLSSSHLTLKGLCKKTEYFHTERTICTTCQVDVPAEHRSKIVHSKCDKRTENVCPF